MLDTTQLQWSGVYTPVPEHKSGWMSSRGGQPIAGSNKSYRDDRWYDCVLTAYTVLQQSWVVGATGLSPSPRCGVKPPTESNQGTTRMPWGLCVYHRFGGSVGDFVDSFPGDLVGKGVVPFVLLAQVVQDQQAQLLLRAELSELHLRRSFTKQH